MDKLLLNRREAAQALAISVHSIDALVDSGQLPVVRIGRAVRFHADALAQFAAKGSPNRTVHGRPRNFGKGKQAA